MRPDPVVTEAAADRADSVVGMAEKVRQNLTASIALCRRIAQEGSSLAEQASYVAEELRVLLTDEVIPMLHAAEEEANQRQIEVEDAYHNPERRA
jgi:flagellar biosynthesis regulator FlaF